MKIHIYYAAAEEEKNADASIEAAKKALEEVFEESDFDLTEQ